MAIDERLAYQIGSGNTTPQMGYGQAQVIPNDMAAGIQQGIQNAATVYQIGQKERAAAAESDRKKRKTVQDKLKDVDLANPFSNPYLKSEYSQLVKESSGAINSLDPSDPQALNKINAILANLDGFKSQAEEIEIAWTSGLKDDSGEYYVSEEMQNVLGGRNWEVNPEDYNTEEALAAARKSATRERVLNADLEADSVLPVISEGLFNNPEYFKATTEIKDRGDINEIMSKSVLTEGGIAQLGAAILNTPSIDKAIDQEYFRRGGSNTGESPSEYKLRRINEIRDRYVSKFNQKTLKDTEPREDKKDYSNKELQEAKDVKDSVARFQANPSGSAKYIEQYIKPRGWNVEYDADNESVSFYKNNKDGEKINQTPYMSVTTDDGVQALYTFIANNNPHIKRGAIDVTELRGSYTVDPSGVEKIEKILGASKKSSFLGGKDPNVEIAKKIVNEDKYFGDDVTYKEGVVTIDGEDYDLSNKENSKEAYNLLKQRLDVVSSDEDKPNQEETTSKTPKFN